MNRLVPLVALVIAASLFAACGSATGPLGSVPSVQPTPDAGASQGEPDLTPAPSIEPSESPEPSVEPSGSEQPAPTATPTGTSIVRAYFHLGGEPGSAGLVAVLREVPKTKAVATAAMAALLAGPRARSRPGASRARSQPARSCWVFPSRMASQRSTCRGSSSRAVAVHPC